MVTTMQAVISREKLKRKEFKPDQITTVSKTSISRESLNSYYDPIVKILSIMLKEAK